MKTPTFAEIAKLIYLGNINSSVWQTCFKYKCILRERCLRIKYSYYPVHFRFIHRLYSEQWLRLCIYSSSFSW